jgi:hypothetical protein
MPNQGELPDNVKNIVRTALDSMKRGAAGGNVINTVGNGLGGVTSTIVTGAVGGASLAGSNVGQRAVRQPGSLSAPPVTGEENVPTPPAPIPHQPLPAGAPYMLPSGRGTRTR